jgi:hypothetical protein
LIGRATSAVRARRKKLKIHSANPALRRYTPSEDRLLGTKSDTEIARILRRPKSSITDRRWRLGIKPWHSRSF